MIAVPARLNEHAGNTIAGRLTKFDSKQPTLTLLSPSTSSYRYLISNRVQHNDLSVPAAQAQAKGSRLCFSGMKTLPASLWKGRQLVMI